jgi:hypothetical protein
VSELFLWQ